MPLPDLGGPQGLEATLREVMDELHRLIELVDEAPSDAVTRGARILNRAALHLALAARAEGATAPWPSFAGTEENPVALAASIAAGAASLAAMVVTRRQRLHS